MTGIALAADVDTSMSELRPLIQRFSADSQSLERSYAIPYSETRRARFDRFYSEQQAELGQVNFNTLSTDGRVDYLLFRNLLDHERKQLQIDAARVKEIAPLLPFGDTIVNLEEARKRMQKLNPQTAAALVAEMDRSPGDKVSRGQRSPGDRRLNSSFRKAPTRCTFVGALIGN